MKHNIQTELKQQAALQREATTSTADRVICTKKLGGESVTTILTHQELNVTKSSVDKSDFTIGEATNSVGRLDTQGGLSLQ